MQPDPPEPRDHSAYLCFQERQGKCEEPGQAPAGTPWGQVHAASTPSSSALFTELCIFHLPTKPISPVLTDPQGALARSPSYGSWMIRDAHSCDPIPTPTRPSTKGSSPSQGGSRRAFRSHASRAQLLLDLPLDSLSSTSSPPPQQESASAQRLQARTPASRVLNKG